MIWSYSNCIAAGQVIGDKDKRLQRDTRTKQVGYKVEWLEADSDDQDEDA